jgi:hypothetical protein
MNSPFTGHRLAYRPLPRNVRPVQDETIDSYLRRLGGANGVSGYGLELYLKGPKNNSVEVDSLAAISGQPPVALRYAILELCSADELSEMSIEGRPRPGGIQDSRCSFCMHSRGIQDLVRCWRRSEDVICLHHHRWIGSSREISLTGQPDITQANRRHRRLIRRHGRRNVFIAFNQARNICEEWIKRGDHRDEFDRRMRLFLDPRQKASFEHPALAASLYPQVVAMTRLIVTPYWRALALRQPGGDDAFIDEVRHTVAPNYSWYPYSHYAYYEPLVRWFRDEHDTQLPTLRQHEDRRRKPIDVIEFERMVPRREERPLTQPYPTIS